MTDSISSSESKLRERWTNVIIGAAVFAVALGGLSLVAWDRVTGPSPHFHFIDLAESFMAGRLDTLTPERRKDKPELPGDPPGLQTAVDRQVKSGGWNDWVGFYVVTLDTGEVFKGVWPWGSRKNGQKNYDLRKRFVTLAKDWVEFDRAKDVLKTCVNKPELRGDKVARAAWQTRDKWDAEHEACLEPIPEGGSPRRCGRNQARVTCVTKRHYVSFPPGPAVAMLPFVAIWHYNFNDVVFTLLLAALNSLLLFVVLVSLRRLGYVDKSNFQLLTLVFLFTFGTVAFFTSVRGEVWFTALVMGMTLHLASLYFATDLRNPFLAGLFLALGVATRVPLAFASTYFILLLFLQRAPWSKQGILLRLKQGVLFALPCLAVGGALMWYNYARFESPFEFGHRFLLNGTRDSIVDHGLFSFWFLPRNLSSAFTNVPQFISHYPYVKITGHGLSLLATTPVFFYLLWPRKEQVANASRDKYRLSLHTILWITVAVTAAPGLLYQNSGWLQFGYRFAMDYLPLLLILLAVDGRKPGKLFYALVLVSVAVNLFGAITFSRFPQFYH